MWLTMFSIPSWSAFADVFTPDPLKQLDLVHDVGLQALVLRRIWERSVETLTDAEAESISAYSARMNVPIHSLATMFGMERVTEGVEDDLPRMSRLIDLARRLQTDTIRMFSFLPPDGGKPASYMGAAIQRLKPITALAEQAGLTLLIENAPDTIGSIPSNIHTVVQAQRSASVKTNWNTAHFVQAGIAEHVIDYWLIMERSTGHVTLTDALLWDRSICLPGDGDAQVSQMLMMLRTHEAPYGITLDPCLPGEEGFALTLARVRQCSLLQGVMA